MGQRNKVVAGALDQLMANPPSSYASSDLSFEACGDWVRQLNIHRADEYCVHPQAGTKQPEVFPGLDRLGDDPPNGWGSSNQVLDLT